MAVPFGPTYLSSKAASYRMQTDEHLRGEWDNGVPAYYEAQAQWGLAVSGLEHEDFGVLVGGSDFRTFRIHADKSLHDHLFARALEFWKMVKAGTMPAIDGSNASTDALRRRFRHAEPGTRIELGLELRGLVGQWLAAKEFVKAAEEHQAELENRIKIQLGNNEVGMAMGPSSPYDRRSLHQSGPDQHPRTDLCSTIAGIWPMPTLTTTGMVDSYE